MVLWILEIGLLAACASAAFDGNRFLWYSRPAADWESESLPIGNSRLGATIFGSRSEVVTINEETIWTGPLVDRTPPDALSALPRVRQMLRDGQISAAGDLTLRELTPAIAGEEGFSYFGDLNVDFGHDQATSLVNYQRWLDTLQGTSGVSYTFDGINFTREYVASFPKGVLAARFTSSQEGALSLRATFSRTKNVVSNTASVADGVNSILMRGTSGQQTNPIQFSGKAQLVADGSITSDGGTLSIAGATTVDVFIDVQSNYHFSSQQGWEAELDQKLSAAVGSGFEQVRAEAISDATSLTGRASLDLGISPDGLADLPTDERVAQARGGLKDIQLVTLAWSYGRHLLASSSRKTRPDGVADMPANLQGVWNNSTGAPWGGKYTININIEMNYWPAAQTNLVETQVPLFDLFNVARPRGESLAREMYGCGGTVFHHNLNLWGDPAPTDNYTSSTMWPMGAAWLVQHQIDHYRFTGDLDFLRDTAWPNLVAVAEFYQCYAFDYQGFRVTGPSLSAENTFVIPSDETIANAAAAMDMDIEMDNQLMRDVMLAVVEAAEALGMSSSDEAQAARAFLPLIRPPAIGSYGQILEWRREYRENEPGNRHLSPLYGLHPSRQFSPLVNDTLSAAAGTLLDHRVASGSGSTGWSRTWMINLSARRFLGAEAWKHIEAWFARYPMSNLWNSDHGATFQIDGNFGFTSGLTETLLQSHAGVVHVLPALMADAVPTGSATGLLARGGFVVDVDWSGGKLERAVVMAQRGGSLALRVADGQDVFVVNGAPYTGAIETVAGEKVVVTMQ